MACRSRGFADVSHAQTVHLLKITLRGTKPPVWRRVVIASNATLPQTSAAQTLHKLAPAGSRFSYTYDFGDDWVHAVEVEKLMPVDVGATYPASIAGRRACPPEDCGGSSGLRQLLAASADRAHEDHDAKLEWIGGSFHPEAFDPTEFEQRLEDRPVFDD